MRYRAIGLVLGTLACDGGAGSRMEPPPDAAPPPVVVVLTVRELDAYAAGLQASIRGLRTALHARKSVDWARLDSTAAAAARLSVPQYRTLAAAVDSALKRDTVFAARMPRLDSLRVDLKLLRVRAEATQ